MSFLVELDVYEQTHGAPDPNDIVWEEVPPGSGMLKQGATQLLSLHYFYQ